jgi:hypothetical protein
MLYTNIFTVKVKLLDNNHNLLNKFLSYYELITNVKYLIMQI